MEGARRPDVRQRSQPAGTLARRASSSISAIALVCLAMSAFTRSCSAMAAKRLFSMTRALRRIVHVDELRVERR